MLVARARGLGGVHPAPTVGRGYEGVGIGIPGDVAVLAPPRALTPRPSPTAEGEGSQTSPRGLVARARGLGGVHPAPTVGRGYDGHPNDCEGADGGLRTTRECEARPGHRFAGAPPARSRSRLLLARGCAPREVWVEYILRPQWGAATRMSAQHLELRPSLNAVVGGGAVGLAEVGFEDLAEVVAGELIDDGVVGGRLEGGELAPSCSR